MKDIRDTDGPKFLAALEGGLASLTLMSKSDLYNHSILRTRVKRIELWIGKSLPRPPARMASLDEIMNYAQHNLRPHTLMRRFPVHGRIGARSARISFCVFTAWVQNLPFTHDYTIRL
jgi:hypothetical protein